MTGSLIGGPGAISHGPGNLKGFKIDSSSDGRKSVHAPGTGMVKSFDPDQPEGDIFVMRLKCGLSIKITIRTNMHEPFMRKSYEDMFDREYVKGEELMEYCEHQNLAPSCYQPVFVDAATLSIMDWCPVWVAAYCLPDQELLVGSKTPLMRFVLRGEGRAAFETYIRGGLAPASRYGIWQRAEAGPSSAWRLGTRWWLSTR